MMSHFWNRLPAIVRGILVAELVVTIGTIPPSIAVIVNMRTSPSIPWMLVVTVAWLSVFWWYVSGHGWPRSTQEGRRRDLRAPSLSKPAWIWALIAGTLGITGTIAILISGIMFFLDHHLSHAYATFVFLPFFLTISAVHGLLVKYSGSIRPSILLHALADFIVIPVTYGLVGSFSVESLSVTGIDRQFIFWVAVMVICLGAFVPALRVLGRRSETAY